jgi:uncharacterized protein (TIGR02246 family)
MYKHHLTIGLAVALIAFGFSQSGRAQSNPAGESGIKQALADYIDGFNHHDGAAVAAAFAEDAERTTVRGEVSHGRSAIEKSYAGLFGGTLKNAHRTATVKSVRFLTAEIALVDADYELTGRTTNSGAEQPPAKGLLSLVFTKHGDKWLITEFHEQEMAGPAM